MDLFFNPRSVAVVGVSESKRNMGRHIVRNLHEFCFDGIIYLVGPKGGTAFGRRIHKSVADIPDQVDLAIVLAPAHAVPAIVEECGQKGIRRLVIESAGFSEYSEDGAAIERQLVETCARHAIRFIGPNCIGVINMANGLCAPFARVSNVFARGRLAIISQSGGVGLGYLNVLASENIGLAKFASIGNRTDVDECDLLEYLIDDEQTEIICMYLEGIADGRRLMDIARRTAKPILLHKSNIGTLASEIAQSHTASLSGDDAVVSAALEQVGIARFDDAHTLVNYLKILPLPRLRGDRLAVLSRSGGHAVIAADVCEKEGFRLIRFPERFLREIEKHFRANVIRLTNPLDLGDLFDFDVYTRIVEETLELGDVDGVVFMHTYISAVEGTHSRALFERIEELSFQYGKPVAICVSTDEEEMSKLRKSLPHPVYTEPEDAIHSLALVRDFAHQARPVPRLPAGELDRDAISAVLARCAAEQRAPQLDEGLAILRAAGLDVPAYRIAASAGQAEQLAAEVGAEHGVALKLVSAAASHKTDVGGVRLGLRGEAVRAGYEAIEAAAGRAGIPAPLRVLVQPMVPPGVELILGARRDAAFGPVVLVGLGGIFVEILRDTALRVVPLEAAEVEGMIRSLAAFPLLAGVRGQPARDVGAVREALLCVARLMTAFPSISELDVNPLVVGEAGRGAKAVDARLVLAS
ncbi:MAG: acetate--CoA ligase family protein [Deltaproteobacteria bacterium]|nr:acetate--CoA ligase family protein [Deltaproteobacteria bacterium]